MKKILFLILLVPIVTCKKSPALPDCGQLKIETDGKSIEMCHGQAIYYKSQNSYVIEVYDKNPGKSGFGCAEFVKLYTEGGSNPEDLLQYRFATKGDEISMVANGSNHLMGTFGKLVSKSESKGDFLSSCIDDRSEDSLKSVHSEWKSRVLAGGLTAEICDIK